jgi:hypothetical protein
MNAFHRLEVFVLQTLLGLDDQPKWRKYERRRQEARRCWTVRKFQRRYQSR